MKTFITLLLCILFSVQAYAVQNKSNPDISLNGLFTYKTGAEGNSSNSESTNGFALQEAELRMNSNIDTYFRGDLILAVENEAGEYHVEPEEAFIETINTPGFTLRFGKFYPYWGRSNQWHTHSYAFIDAQQTKEAIFGEEGFNEVGMSISYLVPVSWYFEFVAQAFNGDNEAVFGSSTQDDVAGVYYVKNLWDISENSTLEFNLGHGHGRDINKEINHIYNWAITYKHRPSGSKSYTLTAEYTTAQKLFDENGVNQGRTAVLSTWLQYQFAKRWWAQIRHETVSNLEFDAVEDANKSSFLMAFVPSEFSAVRLQYDSIDDPSAADTEQRVTLQFNVTMGAHPAHEY